MAQESFPEIVFMAYVAPTIVMFFISVIILFRHVSCTQDVRRLYVVCIGSVFMLFAVLFIVTIILLPEGRDFGMLQVTLDWYIPSVMPISVLFLIGSYIRMAADRKN